MPEDPARALFDDVEAVAASHTRRYPLSGQSGGGAPSAQPVHTAYVPAHRFSPDSVAEMGAEAQRLLRRHAPHPLELAHAFGLDQWLAERVHRRVADKLRREPVEDLRIDFEDGYGVRDEAEEDRDAVEAARSLAALLARDVRPRRVGVRVKSFADGHHRRSVRTLRSFIAELAETHGDLPDDLAITFPKVVAVEHVRAFATILQDIEEELSLPRQSLGFEIQVETPQSILAPDGGVPLPRFLDVAGGRLRAAHFGVFDYTAALGLPPGEQRLDHPACDLARHLMQVALAGTGVELSDGSTMVTPADDDARSVHGAWQRHARDVRHSLGHGYWQGWDMHPSHLVSRFVTVYAFHLADIDSYMARLTAWGNGVAGPGGVLEEPATARVLVAQLRRALNCGAIDASGVPAVVMEMVADTAAE